MDGGFDSAYYEQMSATLLSEQPTNYQPFEEAPDEDWRIAYGKLEARLTALRNWRYSWWVHWSILAQYFLPRRYLWLIVPNRMTKGSPINNSIIDSTGLMAVRTCSAGMLSGLMSPFRPWFTLEIGLPWVELDADGKAWLEDTQEKAYTVLDQSNFYTVMAQAFQDVTVFGTAPMVIYEDDEDVIRCYLPAAGEYYLGTSSRLAVDTFYREFNFTVAQIVGFAGIENCPTSVVKLWNAGQLDTEFVVAHAIEPNFSFSSGDREFRLIPDNFTYREVYWLRGQETATPLSLRGFEGDPFMVARWATTANDAYGRSPCMDALGDNKQVQLETLRKAEVIEKIARPPMGADPAMKNEPASILPGAITFTSTDGQRKGFWPLFQVDAQAVPALTKDIETVNARVQECLFVDLFMAITRMEGVQPRNELELTQRNQERLQELGPFVKMFQNEFAGPVLKRVLEIMIKKRLLKPLPKSLLGVPLKINYVSIMRLAQMALETVALKDFIATAGIMDSAAQAGGQKPPSRVIDLDKALRHYGDLSNAPADIMFTPDQVQKSDQAKTQAAQAAQAAQASMASVTAAKTLSDTRLDPGTALTAITGGQPL